jgi:hypothetical protein
MHKCAIGSLRAADVGDDKAVGASLLPTLCVREMYIWRKSVTFLFF